MPSYPTHQKTCDPGTEFSITPTASVWYVCVFHADGGMKGTITVLGGSGIEEPRAQDFFTLAPDPASADVPVLSPDGGPLMVRFCDAIGRTILDAVLNGDRHIDTRAVGSGISITEIRTPQGVMLSRQRLVITR